MDCPGATANFGVSNSIKTLLVQNTSEDWFEKFGLLKRFYENQGNANPKQKEPIIGTWVNNMRMRKHKLSHEKIKELCDI